MIGMPCDVGTPGEGTLDVLHHNNNDGTDSVSLVCNQNNPIYAPNLTVIAPPHVILGGFLQQDETI